ncbi:uracil-DNA glycosylase [Limnohabitans sp. Jir61]|uniref:uracil-DNA glycosylase n=1 Tax=Limnohabitans sp. Jir61 TaxID=1826168 RepID=UPI000D33F330|nr:uracil-DNA glycosylase [Limnohabitans sp. Jir61]PUE29764.1 uracil-DNA glycosylase [Limnohabitans sp. Jir61]
MTGDLFGDSLSAAAVAPRLTQWSPDDWSVQSDWQPTLDAFWRSTQGASLAAFVQSRLDAGAVIYPKHPLWALQLTPLLQVNVVILGQDPYHGPHQAQGLSFSVAPGVKIPPSLRNIFKELQRDLNQSAPQGGSLEVWAKRGVLLLNTCLTVEDNQPASHAKRGWEQLTDALLAEVARTAPACVYMLWGGHAQAKAELIERETAAQPTGFVGLREGVATKREALVLKANHPSPLSALRPPQPFIGCGHFSQAKAWLAQKNLSLDWNL